MLRRTTLFGIAAMAARPALGQEAWPARSVRLIVPFAAGSSSDTLARLITAPAAAPLGASFIVENRAGAGGLLAVQQVARAAPDGYTLLWGGGTAITNAVMQRNPGFEILTDFTPVITILEFPAVLCVRDASPLKDIPGLIAASRAVPGGLRYGSGGVGTPAHMAAAAMLKLFGTEGTHVPYRGANQATLAVEQGEVDFAFAISNIAVPRRQQGAVRILATGGAKRMPVLPEVPTLAELVQGGPVVVSQSSIIAPAGLRIAIAERIHAVIRQTVTTDASLRAMVEREGGDYALSDSPAAYAANWEAEFRRLQQLVELSGARIE